MKTLWSQIKWMAGQTRPFIFSLSLTLIIETLLSIASVSMAFMSKNLIDGATAKQKNLLIISAILFIVIVIGQVILEGILTLIRARNTEGISNSMRQNLFNNLTQTEWNEL